MLKVVSLMLAGAGLVAAGEPGGCSVASIKGNYGFVLLGTKPAGPPPAPLEQMIGVNMAYFDGRGHSTGTDTIHGAMTGTVADRPVTGTYTVNEDCSGSMSLFAAGSPPLELRFVLVNSGKEIRAVTTSPASVMVTANGTRM